MSSASTTIDWSFPSSLITPHFTVKDATYLPSWKIYHTPSDSEKANLVSLMQKMEIIRTYLGENPINVSCTIRPTYTNAPGSIWNGRNYNQFIGGAPLSSHRLGLAMDFTVSRMTCDDVRLHLQDQLINLNIYMEKKQGAGWVHINLPDGVVRTSRYFVP